MAEIRCPNCGRNNPDLLDVCQFCQTRLKPDSVLRIGQQPTKKNTGELEPILPDWLKDVRQQARDSADESAQTEDKSKPVPEEPPDLLGGLASQTSDEEEIPDWLASMSPGTGKPPATPAPSAPEPDLFSQFGKEEAKPAAEPAPEEQPPAASEPDELSAWFSQAAGQPEEVVELDPNAHDSGWGTPFVSAAPKEPPPEEDLGWLRDLEQTAKQTGDLKAPKQGSDWMANFNAPPPDAPTHGSQDDLSWLDRLGGIEAETPLTPEPTRDAKDDLSWLNNLGAAAEPSQSVDAAPDQPILSQPPSSEEDLSWLRGLGSSTPAQPFSEPAAEDQPVPKDDLSWLHSLEQSASSSQPAEPAATSSPLAEEPDWLKGIPRESESLSARPFVDFEAEAADRQRQAAAGEPPAQPEMEPDWLRRATEAPSMPPPGDPSLDWFANREQPAREKPFAPEEQPGPAADLFSIPAEPGSSLSNQDVDSLFSQEMPDWLSRPEPDVNEPPSAQPAQTAIDSEDALAPVELPSWVQAMRPVEAVITETTPGVEEQPEETEGPLAGLRGVIPGATVGATLRPKPVSLKLQATQEQQASAALLEEILGSETSPRALVTAPVVASQQVLRWVLAALFLLVLGATILGGSQGIPVPAALPADASALSAAVLQIPAGSNVLVVIDYEPALAGELEAIGGPLLDQLVSLGRPSLALISTSPNGPALAERLLASASINVPEGYGYQAGAQYRNLGFLPGGSASVLGFMERPAQILPAALVGSFADYSAVVVLTDNAESGRIWVEQLQSRKQVDPLLSGQPLLMVASAQAGPLMQPYVSSGQVAGMLSGLPDAARYQANDTRPSKARSYWDAFGLGLALSVVLILIGGVWSLLTGMRARRTQPEQG